MSPFPRRAVIVAAASTTLRGLARQWRDHPVTLLASGIAFHAILCLIPFILLGTSILGTVLNSSAEAVQRIHELIAATFPASPYSDKIQHALRDLLTDIIRYRKSFGWVGGVGLLWTSSSLLDAVRTALNTLFHLRGSERFFRGIAKNLVLTLVLTLLFLMANLTTWLFIAGGSLLERWDILSRGDVRSYLPGVVLVCSNVPVFLMFYILYRFVPARAILPRAALTGAATATLTWWISGVAFGWYLTASRAGSLYGTYAFLVVSLLWIYFSATAFMVGGMVCQEVRLQSEPKIP